MNVSYTTGYSIKPVVKMIQLSNFTWEIRNPTNLVIQSDISLSDVGKAKEYIINYISSFQNWDYEVIPLNDVRKHDDNI